MTDLLFFVNKSIIYTLKNVCRQNWKNNSFFEKLFSYDKTVPMFWKFKRQMCIKKCKLWSIYSYVYMFIYTCIHFPLPVSLSLYMNIIIFLNRRKNTILYPFFPSPKMLWIPYPIIESISALFLLLSYYCIWLFFHNLSSHSLLLDIYLSSLLCYH